jgi:hypothetical protein
MWVRHFGTPVLYAVGFWKNFALSWLWHDAPSTECSERFGFQYREL